MFEDEDGNELYPFPCIMGFPQECMHACDGGVLKDLINNLAVAVCWRFDRKNPEAEFGRRHSNQAVLAELKEKILFMNNFRFSEQSRQLR